MEITLDLAFVRSLLDQERRTARDDLRRAGALHALTRSQPRHDARIAAAPDVETLACRAGCTWCCHFTVDVRPAEVFAIADYIEHKLGPTARARIGTEVRANAMQLADLDDGARVTRNIRCPFLSEGLCVIYPVRPQSCRNYHATDAAGCQQSYERPEDLDIDPQFAAGVYQAGAAHVEAFNLSLAEGGFDVNAYELNMALAAAWAEPDSRQRFESGQKPFANLDGEEVPLEFDDLEDDRGACG